MTITVAPQPRFTVIRSPGWGEAFTIAEDGEVASARNWPTKPQASFALTRMKTKAENVANSGYFATPTPTQIEVKVDGDTVTVHLPTGISVQRASTQGRLRRAAIQTAVIRHLIDREGA